MQPARRAPRNGLPEARRSRPPPSPRYPRCRRASRASRSPFLRRDWLLLASQLSRRHGLVRWRAGALEQLLGDPRQAARDGHVAEVELGATETQRREPLLAFGTDVSGLGDRLGIVTARRPRIATRHSDVTDAPRLPGGCEGHV